MIFAKLNQRAAAFCDRNDLTLREEGPSWLIGKMICHDALHDILGLDLTDDEWDNDGIEDDVLIVQNLIKNGYSLERIQSEVKDFTPGVVNLTELHVEVMSYFFNLKGE